MFLSYVFSYFTRASASNTLINKGIRQVKSGRMPFVVLQFFGQLADKALRFFKAEAWVGYGAAEGGTVLLL